MSRSSRSTNERLRRLLVMLPWLSERSPVSTAEMAAHFGVTVPELIEDLELAATCGLPPYVDELLDVLVDEETVELGVPRLFVRPLRLTAPEGFALVAAARVGQSLPGFDPDGALTRAVDKVADALGLDRDSLDVDLGLGGTDEWRERVAVLREAVASGRVLRIRYWSGTRDEVTERSVVPRDVLTDRGLWYLRAHDRSVDAERTFRLDRIEEVEVTAETVERLTPDGPPQWFEGSADLETAIVELPRRQVWQLDRLPAVTVEDLGDDRVRAHISVASERWFATLLLWMGPEVSVLSPTRWTDLAARTAAGLARRYTATG